MLDLLIRNEADTSVKDINQRTLLHLAVKQKYLSICKKLISHGLDVNAPDRDGSTPLHLAVELNDVNLVKLLLENGANTEKGDIDGYCPIHIAARMSNAIEVLDILIKHNAKTDAKTFSGDLPIHIAAAVGNSRGFILLFNKSSLNCVNKLKLTPEELARTNGFNVIPQLTVELDKNNNNNAGHKIPVLTTLEKLRRKTKA